MTVTDSQRQQLDERGYVILKDFMSGALLSALREKIEQLFDAEGESAGSEFKQEAGCRRLANLANKGQIFRDTIVEPILLELVRHVLGPEIKLSSLNARSVNPHFGSSQPLHCDMSAIPDERGYWVCNSVWVLDDFTEDNGALRAIPGSHRYHKSPQEVLDDPTQPHPDQVVLTAPAGSLIVMNAHLWHGGLANQTSCARTAMHVFFARRDKPQQQYQKQLLSRAVQESLSPQLRDLLAIDDPLNDQLSSNPTVRSGFLK